MSAHRLLLLVAGLAAAATVVVESAEGAPGGKLRPGTVIRKSGRYALHRDVAVPAGLGFWVAVEAPFVVLDLDGHTVTGAADTGALVLLRQGSRACTLRDGSLVGGVSGLKASASEVLMETLNLRGQSGDAVDLTLSGGSATLTDVTIEDCGGRALSVAEMAQMNMQIVRVSNAGGDGVSVDGGTSQARVSIDSLDVRGSGGVALRVLNALENVVSRSTLAGCSGDGMRFERCDSVEIEDCRVNGAGGDGIVVMLNGIEAFALRVTDSAISGTQGDGVKVNVDIAHTLVADVLVDVDLSGNRISRTGGAGILFQSNDPLDDDLHGTHVRGTISENDVSEVALADGAEAGPAARHAAIGFDGVDFSGLVASNVLSRGSGAGIAGALAGATVRGNSVSGFATGIDVAGRGARIVENLVDNNSDSGVVLRGPGHVVARNSLSTNDFAIVADGATAIRIEENHLAANRGDGIYCDVAGPTFVTGNTLFGNGGGVTGTFIGSGNVIVP